MSDLPKQTMSYTAAIGWGLSIGLAIIGIYLFSSFYFGGGLQKETAKQVEKTMDNIMQKVANDAVSQYNIVKRQGDKISLCVSAGFVSAAFLQAQNEPGYQAWKETENRDCRAAGMPR